MAALSLCELEQPTLTFAYLMKKKTVPFMKLCIYVDESRGTII